jgi:hypothetical protein
MLYEEEVKNKLFKKGMKRVLQIVIPEREWFEECTSTFTESKKETLQLEHSLISISKWESKICKPFLTKEDKTIEETIEYIKSMTITQNVNPRIYEHLPKEVFKQVEEYINAPMTATWFNEERNTPGNREVITSEIIYYWMVALNIPMECQKWHLNRLLTLIRVCNIKNQPKKRRGRGEFLNDRRALNAARKEQLRTKG